MKGKIRSANICSVESRWNNTTRILFRDSEVTRKEYENVRKSFYAGFISCLDIVQGSLNPDPEIAVVELNSLHQECMRFFIRCLREEIKTKIEKDNEQTTPTGAKMANI